MLSLVMSGVLEEGLHVLMQLKKVEGKSAGPGLDEGEQFRVNLYAIVVRPHRRALRLSNIDINRWPNTKSYEVLKSQSEVQF